jgi:hypothetical protein|nr:hypothetical protein [Metabacillus litoralis]
MYVKNFFFHNQTPYHKSLVRQNVNDYGAKGALNAPTLTLPQMLTML